MSEPTTLVKYWSQSYTAPTQDEKNELITQISKLINEASVSLTLQALISQPYKEPTQDEKNALITQISALINGASGSITVQAMIGVAPVGPGAAPER
jgi:phenylpyruvate tautomerase PptA (4-oxalocrotonate tautomerase family)